MTNSQSTKILSPEKLTKLRQPLPRSWLEVVGILKGKKRIAGLRYQKKIRKEWDRRLKRLLRIPNL